MTKDLQVPNIVLPEIVQTMFTQLPAPIDPDSGIIRRKLHKWKLKDLSDISSLEASISAAGSEKVRSTLDGIMQVLTFGNDFQLRIKEIEHKTAMLNLSEKMLAAKVSLIQAEANEKNQSARLMEAEANRRILIMQREDEAEDEPTTAD